nr:phage tail protein [Sphingomonas sp. GM_Shp_2]
MRADDQSTWAYTTPDGAEIGGNVALQILRVLLGWRIGGKLAAGSGVPPRRLDLASFALAANLCDERVNRSAGGTEPRYRAAGVVSEGDDPRVALNQFCAACCGRFRDAGGKLSLVIMHNDLAAAATDPGLGDDDVIGGFTWDPDPSLEATPNVVRGQYVDASSAALYQLVPYPDVTLASLDGIDRVLPIDFAVVESASQVQRVAKQTLQRKQYQRRFAAPFDIVAWRYNVGDVVPLTFAPLGFRRRLFRVVETDPGANPCQMVLEEETPAIYAWDRDDAAPVQPAAPIVYDRGNNPLIRAINDAAATADWPTITGPGKPEDNADSTKKWIEASRFALRPPRIGIETRPRFDPIFWSTNFPMTMIAAVRATAADALRIDATFHERGHLAGLIWSSEDTLDHPTTAYDTARDYRGCVLQFRLRLHGDIRDLTDPDGPTLTIEGRDAKGAKMVRYVHLGNANQAGSTARDALIRLDFDRLPGGYYGGDDIFAGDIDRMLISFVPTGYDKGSAERLDAPIEAALELTGMTATGRASTLTCGIGPGGVHDVRMTNGYDDTYNVTPERIIRKLDLLGYRGEFNHYVGMSHYFRWRWSPGEGRYVADTTAADPLNVPCRVWHEDLAARLKASGRELIVSLSYEMLNSFAPRDWRQLDHAGLPALTGWEPPSALFSPCHAPAFAYLTSVALAFCDIAAAADLRVRFQVGEPWWWIDFRSHVPYFYDPSTVAAWRAEKGSEPPVITNMTAPMTAAQKGYCDWLGERLAASVLDLIAAVRAKHPATIGYALLYLPQLLDARTPEAHRVNMPAGLAYPRLDVLQLEDYDFVIDDRPDLSASARARAETKLGYPRSRQEYFAGFALAPDAGPIWRASTSALAAARECGVWPLYIWAYTQVMRDGYVPRISAPPGVAMSDVRDVALARQPATEGQVLAWDARTQNWRPRAQATRPEVQIPSLVEPWINYGGGFGGARYHRDAAGQVMIDGLVQAPAGAATADVTLFTLLPGYRPGATLIFVTWSGGGPTRIDVLADGAVIMRGGNTAFTSLGGIGFLAGG